MAVDAEVKRSIFTQQLAKTLEQEGIATPSYILDLLDKPFASFSEEDKKLYDTQIKQKELLILFARLLQKIYEVAGESTKHSWKGMCHLLKDSPIKVCVSYVINQEQEQEIQAEQEVETAPSRGARYAAAGGATGGSPPDPSRKSYFTKKLERKLEERAIKVPASIIALLDKPFDEFTAEEMRIYEAEFKGRQLTILFSDLLDELYEETGRVVSGWNAMCRYLKETPMKLIATYVVQEEERLEEVGEVVPDEVVGQAREKLNVKRYQAPTVEQKEAQSRKRRK